MKQVSSLRRIALAILFVLAVGESGFFAFVSRLARGRLWVAGTLLALALCLAAAWFIDVAGNRRLLRIALLVCSAIILVLCGVTAYFDLTGSLLPVAASFAVVPVVFGVLSRNDAGSN